MGKLTEKYPFLLKGHVVKIEKKYPVRGWLMKDGKVCGPFSLGKIRLENLKWANDNARFRGERYHFFNLEVYADNRWQILTEFIYLKSKEMTV